MPELSYPGIYNVNETGVPAAPQGVSASVAAFVGFTLEGKTDELINATSFSEFVSRCGGFTTKGVTPLSVYNFYKNEGRNVKISRVVGDGAAKGAGFFYKEKSAETVTTVPSLNATDVNYVFAATNALDEIPLSPGSLVLTDGTTTFTDNGDGTLTSVTPGCSGTIDYLTGEGTLVYAAAPGVVILSATYDYKTFGFELLWEGLAGNEFRVSIEGDSNYYDSATAAYSRYIVNVLRENSEVSGSYDVVEQFRGLSLTDSTDAKFITLMNDDIQGSSYLEVTVYGNNEVPDGLNGVQVTAEALTPVPVYDGSTRAFVYTAANAINPLSLNMSLYPTSDGEGVGTPTVATTYAGSLGQLPDVSATNTVEIVTSINTGTVEKFVNSATALALVGDQGGSGTIAADGSFSLTAGGGFNFDAVVATASYKWATPMVITDDGLGSISLDSGGGSLWILDPNAINSVVYSTGVVSMTFKYVSSPIVGPAADHASVANIKWTQSADYYAQPVNASVYFDITGGLDGDTITRTDVTGSTAELNSKGIFALNKTDEILQVVVPDFETDYLTARDCIDYCDGRFDRFYVYSAPAGMDYDEATSWKKMLVNRNANEVHACYWPNVKVTDPETEAIVTVPPAGHIVGVYARTFNQVNVSQTPAGIEYGQLKNVVALEKSPTESQVGHCNLENLNCLVDWPNTGLVIWGGRSGQTNGDMPYINMVQTRMYVRKVLNKALYKYVFGSNTAGFRNRVRQNVISILTNLFKSNYFQGATTDDAFYVICDGRNNTQATIDDGELNITVGIALKKPGEFIILKMKQILQAAA